MALENLQNMIREPDTAEEVSSHDGISNTP